jgi:hypothetical protein
MLRQDARTIRLPADRREEGVAIRSRQHHALMLVEEPPRALIGKIAGGKTLSPQRWARCSPAAPIQALIKGLAPEGGLHPGDVVKSSCRGDLNLNAPQPD